MDFRGLRLKGLNNERQTRNCSERRARANAYEHGPQGARKRKRQRSIDRHRCCGPLDRCSCVRVLRARIRTNDRYGHNHRDAGHAGAGHGTDRAGTGDASRTLGTRTGAATGSRTRSRAGTRARSRTGSCAGSRARPIGRRSNRQRLLLAEWTRRGAETATPASALPDFNVAPKSRPMCRRSGGRSAAFVAPGCQVPHL